MLALTAWLDWSPRVLVELATSRSAKALPPTMEAPMGKAPAPAGAPMGSTLTGKAPVDAPMVAVVEKVAPPAVPAAEYAPPVPPHCRGRSRGGY